MSININNKLMKKITLIKYFYNSILKRPIFELPRWSVNKHANHSAPIVFTQINERLIGHLIQNFLLWLIWFPVYEFLFTRCCRNNAAIRAFCGVAVGFKESWDVGAVDKSIHSERGNDYDWYGWCFIFWRNYLILY